MNMPCRLLKKGAQHNLTSANFFMISNQIRKLNMNSYIQTIKLTSRYTYTTVWLEMAIDINNGFSNVDLFEQSNRV